MEEEKKKPKTIKFEELGKPYIITLSFDKPKEGEGEYGTWHLYGGKMDGESISFFAPKKLHEAIQTRNFKKGNIITIIPRAEKTDSGKLYTDYEVIEGVKEDYKKQNKEKEPLQGEEKPVEPSVWDLKDARMCRMNALNRGFDFVINSGQEGKNDSLDRAFEIAQECYDWIYTGQRPQKEAPNLPPDEKKEKEASTPLPPSQNPSQPEKKEEEGGNKGGAEPEIDPAKTRQLKALRAVVHTAYKKCGVSDEQYKIYLHSFYNVESSLEIKDDEVFKTLLQRFNPEKFNLDEFLNELPAKEESQEPDFLKTVDIDNRNEITRIIIFLGLETNMVMMVLASLGAQGIGIEERLNSLQGDKLDDALRWARRLELEEEEKKRQLDKKFFDEYVGETNILKGR